MPGTRHSISPSESGSKAITTSLSPIPLRDLVDPALVARVLRCAAARVEAAVAARVLVAEDGQERHGVARLSNMPRSLPTTGCSHLPNHLN